MVDEEWLDIEEDKELLEIINERLRDSNCRKRYVIASIIGDWTLYFDAERSTYCQDIDSGTHFKKREYAEAVLIAMGNKGTHRCIAEILSNKGR